MSSCRFELDFPGSASTLVDTIRAHVSQAGGRLEGSSETGNFLLPTPVGEFEGLYTIEEQVIRVEVTNKPFFVPCSAIEAKLTEVVKSRRG